MHYTIHPVNTADLPTHKLGTTSLSVGLGKFAAMSLAPGKSLLAAFFQSLDKSHPALFSHITCNCPHRATCVWSDCTCNWVRAPRRSRFLQQAFGWIRRDAGARNVPRRQVCTRKRRLTRASTPFGARDTAQRRENDFPNTLVRSSKGCRIRADSV